MNSIDYPKPSIPLTPVLSFGLKQEEQAAKVPSIMDCRYVRYITSGRCGLVLALQQCGIQSGDEVLVPAFHCESMVAPIRLLDATPVFYRIHHDTSADFEDIAAKSTPKSKAIIVTHYFGVPQNFSKIKPFCDERNIKLIEDCAHAFFGRASNKTIGAHGDYAVASSMKFFPVYDGGILASDTHQLSKVNLCSPPVLFEFKSLINMVENAVHYKRLGLLGAISRFALSIKTLAWSAFKKTKGLPADKRIGPASSEGGFGLDKEWINKESSKISLWVIENSDFIQIAQSRRENYLKLKSELSNLPGCRPLFTDLPDSVVPLVFPLYVDNPGELFPELKWAGIPIWRFGEYLDPSITKEVCSNSVKLSKHVFQFPCHQNLTVEEIDWMIGQIKHIFTRS